jgi:hypothetical protein
MPLPGRLCGRSGSLPEKLEPLSRWANWLPGFGFAVCEVTEPGRGCGVSLSSSPERKRTMRVRRKQAATMPRTMRDGDSSMAFGKRGR